MKCPKCEGFMCLERFGDHFLTFYAGRCINCGAIVEQTNLSNIDRVGHRDTGDLEESLSMEELIPTSEIRRRVDLYHEGV